jgi:hypothetical protein
VNVIGGAGGGIDVLPVEDSRGDVRLTREAFLGASDSIRLHVAADGVEAMAYPRKAFVVITQWRPRRSGSYHASRDVGRTLDSSLKTNATAARDRHSAPARTRQR